MDSPKQSEKDKSKKIATEKKIPAELKSMINTLYYDAVIKYLEKFQEDMSNFGESNLCLNLYMHRNLSARSFQ